MTTTLSVWFQNNKRTKSFSAKAWMIMKLTTILLLFFTFKLTAKTIVQRVTIVGNGIHLSQVFKDIEQQTGVHLFYDKDLIENTPSIDVAIMDLTLQEALSVCLKGQQLSYSIVKNTVLIQKESINPSPFTLPPPPVEIHGRVVDQQGKPLQNVTIMIVGSKIGTTTDGDGRFSIYAPNNKNITLEISSVGYQTKTIKVSEKQLEVNVTLEVAITGLSDVVVVGYGTQQKKVLTGSTVQVNGDKIAKMNTVTTMAALQGSSPGVELTKTSGQPGSDYKMTIHGMGTIGNSSPLFIVDGIIVGDLPAPSEIASLNILKGPMAAIYGSRGANGVVLVTTKSGKKNKKLTISYDAFYGWQNVYKKADILNAQQYLTIINEGMVNEGQQPYDITQLAPSLMNGEMVPMVPNAAAILDGSNKGTNWMQAITNKNAPYENHAVSIQGGSERSTYAMMLGYTTQDGILGKPVASHYDRYNIRINSNFILLVDKKKRSVWEVGENVSYSHRDSRGLSEGTTTSSIFYLEETNPFQPIYGAQGLYAFNIPWDNNVLAVNPMARMVYNDGYNERKNNYLTVSANTRVSPFKGLEFVSRFSSNISAGGYRYFRPTYYLGEASIPATALFQNINRTHQDMSVGLNWIWDNTLSYKFEVKQNHNFSVMVGTSAEKDGLGSSITGTNTGNIFNSFEYAYLSNAPIISAVNTQMGGNPFGQHQLNSYFGRVNYDYKNTYLFSGVIRADGSSNFGPGHRWGTFPALSAGWVISNESFMENAQSWLNFLKIRAGWGKNGNESIPGFQYLSTIQTGTGDGYSYGDKTSLEPGAFPNIKANPDITWEISNQTDIGLDAIFLDNRLTLTLDLYNKKTDGWLVQAPIPEVAGTGAPYINGGNIANRGYEVSLEWHDRIGQFHYSISPNMSYNHNEVTKIEGGGIIYGASNIYGPISNMYVAAVGWPAGVFYGYKTDGIFQNNAEVQAYKNKAGQLLLPGAKPGDVRYVDVNGDGIISDADRTDIGDSHSSYSFGATINLSFKGLDFTFLGTGVTGNKIVQPTDWPFQNDPLANYTTGILQRWHGEGTSNTMPSVALVGNFNNTRFNDMWLQSGNYFRISNLTLGYDFKYLWKNMPLQQARLYVSVQNAYTFTKYRGMDPEVGYAPDNWARGIDLGTYPSPRTFLVGIDVKF